MGIGQCLVLGGAEREALRGLPYEWICLYLEIRWRMDLETGYAGLLGGCGLSWWALREAMFVEAATGRQRSGTREKGAVRRWAEGLERAGLIRAESAGKRLIFFLPLAVAGESVQKKVRPKCARHRAQDGAQECAHGETPVSGCADNGLGVGGAPEVRTEVRTEARIPHPREVRIHHSTKKTSDSSEDRSVIPRARVDRGPMSASHEFDWESVRAHLRMMGLAEQATDDQGWREVVGEFRSYWSAQDAEMSGRQWDQKLAKAIKRAYELRRSGDADAGHGARRGGGRESSAQAFWRNVFTSAT